MKGSKLTISLKLCVALVGAMVGWGILFEGECQGSEMDNGPVLSGTPSPFALIGGLDKSTGRVKKLLLPLGKEVPFGRLILKATSCFKSAPDELPEAACDIEIQEINPPQRNISLFRDRMYASTPAISALDHPIYDVWVIGCPEAPPEGFNE